MTALLGAQPDDAAAHLPDPLKAPFAEAMSQSMLLPAIAAGLGVVTAIFFVGQPSAGRAVTTSDQSKRNVSTAL